MNKQERIETYKNLVEGKGLWDVDHGDVNAFYKRAESEGLELVSNNVPHLGLFRAPYSRKLSDVDIALVRLPMELGAPNPRLGIRNAPRVVRFWGG